MLAVSAQKNRLKENTSEKHMLQITFIVKGPAFLKSPASRIRNTDGLGKARVQAGKSNRLESPDVSQLFHAEPFGGRRQCRSAAGTRARSDGEQRRPPERSAPLPSTAGEKGRGGGVRGG